METHEDLRRRMREFLSVDVPRLMQRMTTVRQLAPLILDEKGSWGVRNGVRDLEKLLRLMKSSLDAGRVGFQYDTREMGLLPAEEALRDRLRDEYRALESRMGSLLRLNEEGIYVPGRLFLMLWASFEGHLADRIALALGDLERAVEAGRRILGVARGDVAERRDQILEDMGVVRNAIFRMNTIMQEVEEKREDLQRAERIAAAARSLVQRVRPVAWVEEILGAHFVLGPYTTPWQKAVYDLVDESFLDEYKDSLEEILDRVEGRYAL